MVDSLLPRNASDLERALERVLSRTESVPIPIANIQSHKLAPASTLPWLAWSLSVDHWSSAWTDDMKRAAIESSFRLHRTKGTRGAIEEALATVGVRADIEEWFEQTPIGVPGTFKIRAWVSQNLSSEGEAYLSSSVYDALKRYIDTAKSARAHYEFDAGIQFEARRLGIAGVATATASTRVGVSPYIKSPEMSSGMALVSTANASAVTRKSADALMPSPRLSSAMTFVATSQCSSLRKTTAAPESTLARDLRLCLVASVQAVSLARVTGETL